MEEHHGSPDGQPFVTKSDRILKILDRYILKKYFTTFFFTLIILIPIAIAIDVSEKVGKFLKADDLTLNEILYDYYVNFIIKRNYNFLIKYYLIFLNL